MKNIAILGSSGSIGKNALWVVARFPEELKIFGLSVNSDVETLGEQTKRFSPPFICIADENAARTFSARAGLSETELLIGERGLEALASHPDVDIVINAVVGFAGLRCTIAAARAGKRIALANKESMVAGGEIVNMEVAENDAEIIPVDSEHSAIFQCLKSGRSGEIKRLILTSSGGPFRNYPLENLSEITVEQALNHPTWRMGKKVTIDSATLMNKGLEIIEAVYLFNIPEEKIDVVIHPQSIVHSMVEFIDGSIVAQLSKPDMRLPLQYALFYPERRGMHVADVKFDEKFSLDFENPDNSRFPSLDLAREAIRMGKVAPAVFNAADEVAVEAFLDRRVKFPDIFDIVGYALHNTDIVIPEGIESIVEADRRGRESARRYLSRNIK